MNELPYNERVQGTNLGEQRFEEWARNKGYKIQRFGFNEIDGNINGFFLVHPLIRSLPDYVLYREDKKKLIYIHVKGTISFKINDLISYSQWESFFCNENVVLNVVFCLKDQDPVILSLDQIRKKMTHQKIQVWHDGKQYVDIPGIKKQK